MLIEINRIYNIIALFKKIRKNFFYHVRTFAAQVKFKIFTIAAL